ncbi:MAG: hypothetical protein LBE17_05265, partial [Treponema sp.]|nr:hypothetical protein [Treponema sp.]
MGKTIPHREGLWIKYQMALKNLTRAAIAAYAKCTPPMVSPVIHGRKVSRCLIENVTQIKIRAPEGGHPNGVKHERKQAVTREYMPPYQEAAKKEKRGLLDEFTRQTGYHRKSAVRLLSEKPDREV